MGEINFAGPGRPDSSIYFLALPREFSATQLQQKQVKNEKERKKKTGED
jgi:hypothetical protein